MTYLFCYGSNNPTQLTERLGKSFTTHAAVLARYGRVFRGMSRTWGGGVANVIPDANRSVFGFVVKVTERDLRVMDGYEGRAYQRTILPLVMYTGEEPTIVDAVVYTTIRDDGVTSPPTREYLKAIVKTINAHWENVTIDDIRIV